MVVVVVVVNHRRFDSIRFDSIDHHTGHGSRHVVVVVVILIRPIPPPEAFFKRTSGINGRRPTSSSSGSSGSSSTGPLRLLPRIPHRGLGLPGHGGFALPVRGPGASGVLLARPQARQDDLLHAGLDAALVDPGVQPAVDQLGDLRYVLQAGAGADEGADAQVKAVVGQEGEGEGGRRRRRGRRGRWWLLLLSLSLRWGAVAGRVAGGRGVGRQEGDGERAGEALDRDGQGDGQDGGERVGIVEDHLRLDAQGDEVAQVHVHPRLQPGSLGPVRIAIVVIHGMHPAIAQDWKFLP